MKKIITGAILATTIGTAQAVPAINQINYSLPSYNHAYNTGYSHGKNTAYQNVATTFFVVGAIAIAGVVIYHLGEENGSRWGVSENGLTYKF